MVAARTWEEIDWSAHRRELRIQGRRVRFVDYGEGPPLLLVHGMGGSWESWLANIPALGERYRVIAVDLPGFGGSDALPSSYPFGAYVEVLEQLLDELDIPAVAVAGHSLGGLVALTFGAEASSRVRCIVLVSGGGAELSAVRLTAIQAVFWIFRIALAVPGVSRLIVATPAGRLLLSPAVHDWRSIPKNLLVQMIPRSIGPGFMDAVRRGSRQLGALDISRVQAPVLLIWGRNDRILPVEDARGLAASLLQAQLVVLDGVGHCAMFEASGEVNDLVTNFLAMQAFDRGRPVPGRASAAAWLVAHESDDEIEGCEDGTA